MYFVNPLVTLSCDTVESECHFSLSFALCQLPTHRAEGIFDKSHDGLFSLLSLRYVIRPHPASRRISSVSASGSAVNESSAFRDGSGRTDAMSSRLVFGSAALRFVRFRKACVS